MPIDEVRGTPRAVPGTQATAGIDDMRVDAVRVDDMRVDDVRVDAIAMQQIIATLAGVITQTGPEQDLVVVFEREVQQMLRMRAVRLREIPTRYQVRLVTPTRTADSLVLGVPNADPRVQVVLEATCDPNRDLDERDYHVLSSIAQLAGLVLEASRGRTVTPRLRTSDGAAPLIGSTPAMQDLRSRIERVAQTDFTVLIEGESGVGKELVARQVHELSRRHRGPFVAVNCAAVVESLLEAELFGIEERTATGVRGRRGKFENADGGTIFLDEVSDLSASAQAKLLRAIQEVAVERVGGHGVRRVNTRIVAATNRPLTRLVEQRLFRPDLYYRLAGVEITVPPLRERADDVLELARYFLERLRYTRTLKMSAAAHEALRAYQWPGNVRELQRVIERAVALAETESIELDDLPPQVRGEFAEVLWPSLERGDSLRSWGTRYAQLVFERCGRNKRTACRVLDISYHTLRGYLRPPSKRRSPSPPNASMLEGGTTHPQWVQSTSDISDEATQAGEES
jgi:transcriptional regulator with PAS, ATPase and Fis domain